MSENLLYTKEHEWVKFEGKKAYIGITDYAQSSLGDIVFVELPEIGAELKAGDVIGTVESVKTVSDVYSPVTGKVMDTNGALEDDPSMVNSDAEKSWIAVLETDGCAAEGLMNVADYKKFCEEEHE